MPKRYPPEFLRKVLDLVASGRRAAPVAADLDISDQAIYTWRRQDLVDTGNCLGRRALTTSNWSPRVVGLPNSRPRLPSTAAPVGGLRDVHDITRIAVHEERVLALLMADLAAVARSVDQ